MNLFQDCQEFTKLYNEKTGKQKQDKINVIFISKMIKDEFEELDLAKDETEEVDALLDAIYYILQHLSSTTININCNLIRSTDFQSDLKLINNKIEKKKITNYMETQLIKLKEASDEMDKVNILIQLTNTILTTLVKTGLNIHPIWNLIHKANMTKFGPGGYVNQLGKWCKPKDFVPPDEDIRKEILKQRN